MFHLPVCLLYDCGFEMMCVDLLPAKCSMTPSSRDVAMNSAEGAYTNTVFRQTLLLVRSVEGRAL